MNATPRQTAGNNPALKAIKATMNAPIYRQALALMNSDGPEAVRDFLRDYFRPEVWGWVDELMAGNRPV